MKSSLPASITKVSTLQDNTLRLVVDCQEMSPEVMSELFQLKGRLGWMFFHEAMIKDIDLKDLPEIKLETQQKTPSARLRSCLYVLWQQSKETISFDMYYAQQMEKIIEHIKSLLAI